MNTPLHLSLVLATVCLMWACPPAPLPPVTDASDGASPPQPPDAAPTPPQDASLEATPAPEPLDDFDAACARLALLGCPEYKGRLTDAGGVRTCAENMRVNATLFDAQPKCLMSAKTGADVRACCPGGKLPGGKGVCSPTRCVGK